MSTTGSLNRLVAVDHVVGITSDPTISANAIRGSYDEQIRECGRRGLPAADVLRQLTVEVYVRQARIPITGNPKA